MFDWIRNFTKSAEERRQEMLTAYVDDELSAAERARFEQMMADDASLKAEMERQRQFKRAIQSLPRAAAPRNFILSKAAFQEAPTPQRAIQLYPVLRTATALAAVFMVIVVVAGTFSSRSFSEPIAFDTAAPAAEADESVALQSQAEGEAAESGAFELPAEQEAEAEADVAAEIVVEEELLAEEEMVEEAADAEMANDGAADEEMTGDDADAFEPPRPAEATAEPPRADDVATTPQPTVVAAAPTADPELAMTAPAAPREVESETGNEEQVTIRDGAIEADPDLGPLLVFAAIGIFLILLIVTLYVRYQKNNI